MCKSNQEVKPEQPGLFRLATCSQCKRYVTVEVGPDLIGQVFVVACPHCGFQFYVEAIVDILVRCDL